MQTTLEVLIMIEGPWQPVRVMSHDWRPSRGIVVVYAPHLTYGDGSCTT